MNRILKSAKLFGVNFFYSVIGIIALFGLLPVYLIFSFPIYLYRWLICQVLAPTYRGDPGKAVTTLSSIFANELYFEGMRTRPRCAIAVNVVFEGTLKYEEVKEVIHRKWITGENPKGGGLLYPELQQYIGRWMGYLFWTQDKDFNLDNHLTHHQCKESWTEGDCEQFIRSKVEDSLTKPFPRGRSPWEVHVINGYRNSGISPGAKEMTIILFRFHHGMGDGFGFMSLVYEGMLGIPLSACRIATASKSGSESRPDRTLKRTKPSCFSNVAYLASFPIRFVRDGGYAVCKFVLPLPIRTPWYVPEGKGTGRLFYDKTGMVPISKIKFVKNKYGVSFTSVVASSIAAGIARSFKSKGFHNRIKELPFLTMVPLKDHPNTLRNHWSSTALEIPIDQTLDPLQRLKDSEKLFRKLKLSTIPLVAHLALKSVGSLLPSISRRLFTNRTLSAGFSNFPGSGAKLTSDKGWNLITQDCSSGLIFGVAGVGFVVLSYFDHIRIAGMAENAVMDRSELGKLIQAISDEIDNLYELAKKDEECAKLNIIGEGDVMLEVK